MANEVEKTERQYLSLLLGHRDLVEDYQTSSLSIEHFDPSRRAVIHAIEDAHAKGVKLTRRTFVSFINKYIGSKQERAKLELEYNHITYNRPSRNDFPLLKETILNSFLLRSSGQYIREFNELKDKHGIEHAIKQLAANMDSLSTDISISGGKIVYDDIVDLSSKHVERIEGIRDGTIEDDEFISFGIDELDYTSSIGLAPGTLTLFCGDVGGFKSTQMLNVASNVWWQGDRNVLFIPLEMPEDQIWNKWISRQTKIANDYINNPKDMSDEQLALIKKFLDEAKDHNSRFFIMDSYENRSTVSLIRQQIERHVDIFKPRLVVVDYIANLESDKPQNGRNDLEIGAMLKDLRHMGRPGVIHDEGFAIISGAQIGREALKRVRRTGNDKTSFNSEDLRGSHEYSADADMIYAQFPDPQQPDDRLQLYVIKSRYGKKSFADGSRKAVLEVKPSISLIRSTADFYAGGNQVDILQKEVNEDDFSFAAAPKSDERNAMYVDYENTFGGGSSGSTDALDDL